MRDDLESIIRYRRRQQSKPRRDEIIQTLIAWAIAVVVIYIILF